MNRRDFIKTVGIGAGALMIPEMAGKQSLFETQAAVRSSVTENSKTNKSNILIIHTDQQNLETLRVYGSTIINTPNIDRIGHEGAILSNFFANVAVCTPSRGCFLTGRYHHSHGAEVNGRPINQDEITFAKILQQYGYETGYAGKWHLDGYDLRPGWVHPERSMGFEDSHFMFNDYHGKKIEDGRQDSKRKTLYDYTYDPIVYPLDVIGDEESYPTDFLTRKAIDFIEKEREKPFCYMLSIPDPHHPWSVRPPYDTMFNASDMPIPKTFNQKDLPRWAKTVQNNGPFRLNNPERENQLRKKLTLYFGMVKLIDDCVGRILDSLEQKRIIDDTIIIFTTDHGDYNGEHGLFEKNKLYESVYHIPFLIRYPKMIEKGTIVNEFISTVDFQQTLLGLVGIEPCGREQGNDASPLLKGEKIDWKNEVFIYQHLDVGTGIITPEYELAYVDRYHSYEENGLVKCELKPPHSEGILFDRINDPLQEHNLINKPEYAEVVEQLSRKLISHNRSVNSPILKWLEDLEK